MDTTLLTPEERERFDCLKACIKGDLTNAEAAARLGLKKRQVQNLKQAVKKHKEVGVVHGNRGSPSGRAADEETVKAAIAFLQKKKHRDFGPTFAQEQLHKGGVATLSVESVRTLMIKGGLWSSKPRRGPAIHRAWRERRPLVGELVQFDGSYHNWLENGEMECLLGAIDDATSTIMRAVFDDNEGIHAVFRFWWAYIITYGLPAAIYLDKFSTYKINHKNAVDNTEMMTQFERAMGTLGITVICANSPEAKGRVERLFGTLQDRLVKELRLAGIKNIKDANRFLAEIYLTDHNKRFAVSARQTGDAHRTLTKELTARLPSIFSVQSERTVTNDFTLRFKNQWFQLGAIQDTTVYKKETVTIEEWLDGTIHVRLNDTYLHYTVIGKHERAARPRVTALTRERPRWKPPADHPWRKEVARGAEKKISRNAR